MAKPFANSQQYNSTLDDNHIIGIQIGNATDQAGLAQMMYIKLSKLKSFVREGFGELWHYRGEYNTALPTDLAVNDYFLCTGTFTEDGVTYTVNHLYGWNGTTWSDISSILSQYATRAEVALKADKVSNPTAGDVATLDGTGNPVDSGVPMANVIKKSDVVDNVNTQDSQLPLSARMGYEMQQEIDNLKARGRFLSSWNCITGLPTTNPIENPYPYKAGDYYVVSSTIDSVKDATPAYDSTADYAVGDLSVENDTLYRCNTAITGGETFDPTHWDAVTVNYKPSGTSYTAGTPSSAVESAEVAPNDFYEYDGTTWIFLHNTQKTVTFGQIAGEPQDNANLLLTLRSLTGGSPNIAVYDPTQTYIPDDPTYGYCLYGNGVKKCTTTTTGTYDPTCWTDITLWYLSENSGNDVHLSIEEDLDDGEFKLNVTFVAEDYDPTQTYYVGNLCIVEEDGVDVLKSCIEETTGTYNPSAWEDHD